MIVSEAKELLGEDSEKFSEEELQTLIDYITLVSSVLVDNYITTKGE